jgi:hypothetical protein
VDPLNRDQDHENLGEAGQEMVGLYGQPVTVLRFSAWVPAYTLDPNLGVDVPAFRLDTNLGTTAIVSNVTQAEVLTGGGLFQVGDIKTLTLLDVREYKTGQEGDMLYFEGMRYKLVGKPRRVFRGGGRVWVNCTWRKVEA